MITNHQQLDVPLSLLQNNNLQMLQLQYQFKEQLIIQNDQLPKQNKLRHHSLPLLTSTSKFHGIQSRRSQSLRVLTTESSDFKVGEEKTYLGQVGVIKGQTIKPSTPKIDRKPNHDLTIVPKHKLPKEPESKEESLPMDQQKQQGLNPLQKETSEQPHIIKGTQRPDGTWRKDVKIRPGYRNAEMIQRYIIPQKREK